ncbi:MAG: hypothetical protein PHW20_08060, partial [Clostridia bacterium]|nr:hypothetical protein [Clostridia bacterium]
ELECIIAPLTRGRRFNPSYLYQEDVKQKLLKYYIFYFFSFTSSGFEGASSQKYLREVKVLSQDCISSKMTKISPGTIFSPAEYSRYRRIFSGVILSLKYYAIVRLVSRFTYMTFLK